MAGAIGWLLLIWIVGGWLSVMIYVGASVYRRANHLLKKGDKRGAKALGDVANADGVGQAVFEYRRDHPDIDSSPILAKYPALMILAWPCAAKLWIVAVQPRVQEVYEERLKVLEKASE